MLRYSSSVTVNRPPEQVFEYLVDPARQSEWSDVPMSRPDGGTGPLAKGSRMLVTFGMGPMKAKVGLEIIDLVPAKRMAWRSYSGPIRWDGAYELEASGSGGTTLSQEGTLAFTGLWRAIEPIAGAEMRQGEVKELEKLKAVVESK